MMGSTELILIEVIILKIIVWILLIGLAYLLIKHLINRNKAHGVEGKSALDIAKERYAKGEITKEEFEEIKKNLI
jgi:putative membrane protein